ncbi:sensor histidine kinase [Filibacter tadaridae]|uniref:sensor histidine kinase n=1 Tax=Filibacter tadaridae TaxID=2483811 RepID=UPI0013593654|nr:HAMP domain-containing sensor histidine kinase [Filibacter tadaridae]
MKSNNRKRLVVWIALVTLFLMALISIMQGGSKYIGKSYLERDGFQGEIGTFIENLSVTILNPIDLEVEKERITVTEAEIEEHRTRYGTLAEQIGSIDEQYAGRIEDAKAGKSEKLKTALIKERDTKIDDIRKNFEDDAHVEKKIRAEKEEILTRFWNERERNLNQQMELPFAYSLKDIETGETFTSGDINAPASYEKNFNAQEGYLKAESDRVSKNDIYQLDGLAYDEETYYFLGNSYTAKVNPTRKFEGTIILPKSALSEGLLGRDIQRFERTKIGMYVLWGLGILSLVALCTVFRFKREWVMNSQFVSSYNRLKMDIKIALLILSLLGVYVLLELIPGRFSWFFFQTSPENCIILVGLFVVLGFFLWTTVFQLVLLVERLKIEGTLEEDIRSSYSMKFSKELQEMFLNRTIGVQMFLLLIGFFLSGLGLFGVMVAPGLLLIYIPLALFVGFPLLYIFVRRTAYLNRIIQATEAMAQGRLHKAIEVEGESPLADHAKNLNNLREGVRISMSEQAKSERLKTELITNVSHDLRTPLTSIITYTDLLKNEELAAEERAKYVDILDKKSQRLKTLIEDLFEVSKMASGNMELNKQRVDLTQLLQQALAEHAEEISNTGLDFRTGLPDTALISYVDGKRWWRVLDNLIVNAVKYTLPGTRVYITLRKVGDDAEFVIKNITKYELGESVNELFERFKRADTARSTDGSGLGLAIAQSIVDMHNGTMKIEMDGDLFKVTVTVLAS